MQDVDFDRFLATRVMGWRQEPKMQRRKKVILPPLTAMECTAMPALADAVDMGNAWEWQDEPVAGEWEWQSAPDAAAWSCAGSFWSPTLSLDDAMQVEAQIFEHGPLRLQLAYDLYRRRSREEDARRAICLAARDAVIAVAAEMT